MNVSLTSKQQDYISAQVASGDYQNASELVRDAIRIHQHYREKMLEQLRAEIQIGIDSGMSDKSMEDILNEIIQKNKT